MDHAEALASNAAERYLLGELSPLESEEFERHFFVCPECSEDMRTQAIFIENARAVFGDERSRSAAVRPLVAQPDRPRWWSGWFRPVLVPAFAVALLCIVLFQNTVTIPSLKRTAGAVRVLPSFVLLAAARGEDPQIAIPAGTPFYSVYLDVANEVQSDQYRCALIDESGKEKWSVTAPAPPPGKPLTLLIPADATPPGRYRLIVSSGSAESSEYRFRFDYR